MSDRPEEPPLDIELAECLPESERIAYVLRREIAVVRFEDVLARHRLRDTGAADPQPEIEDEPRPAA